MADPNVNYIEHCHWLLVFPLSITDTHSLRSLPGHVIFSGYANCDRRAERKLYIEHCRLTWGNIIFLDLF